MIIAEILASLMVKVGERGFDWVVRHGIPIPSKYYVRRLANDLNEMPFIYVDLQLDVRADYVETDWVSLSQDTSRNQNAPIHTITNPNRSLVDYRHVLIKGEAGMGKTTLFRLAVQSLVKEYRPRSPLRLENDLIPIFVPLKAIDNSLPYPIVRFILGNISYFSGEGGAQRLLRLARKRRVLLLLDAYDEVPYAGGLRSIREEIESLFGRSNPNDVLQGLEGPESAVIDALRRCRIWLSTRDEFLNIYPLKLGDQVRVLQTKGLSSQRINLVKKIFDRYRRDRGQFHKDRLSDVNGCQNPRKAGD